MIVVIKQRYFVVIGICCFYINKCLQRMEFCSIFSHVLLMAFQLYLRRSFKRLVELRIRGNEAGEANFYL